jgi:hypothetical protein
MKFFTDTTTPEEFLGAYGQDYRRGLLIDHIDLFEAAGGTIRVGKHATWAILPGYPAIPVVCGDIIRIDTEDGPTDGRCGLNVGPHGACEGHYEQKVYWASQTEAETCQWERDQADYPNYV